MRRTVATGAGLLALAATLAAAAQDRKAQPTLKSGVEVGAEVKSFEPTHVAGPDRGKRTCPVC